MVALTFRVEYPDTIYSDVLALATAIIRTAEANEFANVPYLVGQLHALDAVATMYGYSLMGDVAYLLPVERQNLLTTRTFRGTIDTPPTPGG